MKGKQKCNMDAIYARQSIDKKDSLSIETQVNFAKNICSGEPRIYIDRGISGKDVVHRPEFQRLLKDIKNGSISRVLVYKLDRFTRSLLDFANTWDYMSKYKVEFISVTENFDTSTPIGKAMIFIMAIFAQMEREQISKRVLDNYYDRVDLGRWPGGTAPYGFSNSTIEIGNQQISSLKVEATMEILEGIMKAYSYPTTSLGDIRRMLLAEKCPGPVSDKWSACSIGRVIRNPASVKCDTGVYKYFKELGVNIKNPIEEFDGQHGGMLVGKNGSVSKGSLKAEEATFAIGNWPGCIESELWLRCQRKLDLNQGIAPDRRPRNSWLTGLLKCCHCGRAVMVRKYVRKSDCELVRFLRCRGKDFYDCRLEAEMTIDTIERAVQLELEKLLEKCSPMPVGICHGMNKIEIELVKVEEAVKNLMQLMKTEQVSDLTMEYINKELLDLTDKKKRLETEKQEALNKLVVPQKIIFSELSDEDRRDVAYSFIETVVVHDDYISVVWKK